MTRIEIVVDELIVRGLSPGQAREAGEALEARLVALAEQSDLALPARAEAFRRVAEVDTTPDALGDAVADAVWKAIDGGRR